MTEADINAHCTEIVNHMRAQGIPPVNGVKIGYITGLQEALKYLETIKHSLTLPGTLTKEEVIQAMEDFLTITPNP